MAVFLANTGYDEVPERHSCSPLLRWGVRLVVHGGMTLGKTNLDEYNRKAGEALTPDEVESLDVTDRQKRQMLASSKVGQRVGSVCAAIKTAATRVIGQNVCLTDDPNHFNN